MERTTITCCIILAATLIPEVAHASFGKPGWPPIIHDCQSPLLIECEDQSYLHSYCGQQNKMACSTMLADQAELDSAGWGARGAHLPIGDDNPQYTAANHPGATEDTVVSSTVQPYDASSHSAQNLNSLYIGTVTRNQTVSVNPSVFAFDPRIGWQSDGTRIKSCEEFVYKRYRTFSQFEDDISPYGTNYAVQLFLALFGEHQLVTSQIYDDGGHPTATLTPPARGKNIFFDFIQTKFADRPNGVPMHQIDLGLLQRHLAYFGNRNYWAGGWDEQIAAAINFQGAYTADELERMDVKVAAFEDLTARRAALMTSYHAEEDFIELNNCRRHGSPAAWCATVDAIEGSQIAALHARVDPQIIALDNQIDAAQHEAEAIGCLDDGMTACDWSPHGALRAYSRQMNAPRELAFKQCQAVFHNDFRNAGSRLARLKAEGWPDAGVAPGDLNQNEQSLQSTIDQVRAFVAAYVRSLPIDPGTGEPTVGGENSDDATIGSWAFGASYNYNLGFKLEKLSEGVSHAEAHAWATFGASGTLFGGDLALVDGSIDVHSEEAGDTTLITHTLSFKVLGQEMMPSDASGTDALTFHVATDPSISQELFRASTVIPVGPIPVKIAGWLTGIAGVEVAVDGGVHRRHAADVEHDALSVDLRGKLTPHAALEAHASASVDLLLIEAGIKGRLTLVKLELPFTLAFGVTMKTDPLSTDPDPPISSVLEGSAQLDLVLHTLDGGITIFVDTPFHNFEKDILTWEGYTSTWPLFHPVFVPIDLSDIVQALQGEF